MMSNSYTQTNEDFDKLSEYISQDSTETNINAITMRAQVEQMLHNATLMTEMALDIKEKCISSEKHVSNLRNFAIRSGKAIISIQNTGKSFLLLAQKVILNAIKLMDAVPTNDQSLSNIKYEYERLLTVLEKELSDLDDLDITDNSFCQKLTEVNIKSISEKIKLMEEKQRLNESCLFSTTSTKSLKSDIDEKYPEKITRDSLMDLDNVINLPSVPEDIFTTFSKPKRTSSLSSLKNLRKVKLFLQRAESMSESDEDRDEWDEQNSSRFALGDSDERDSDGRHSSPTKNVSCLGDIEEEM